LDCEQANVYAMGVITVTQARAVPPMQGTHQQLLQRRRKAKVRQSRERAKNLIRTLVCCGILAVLLVVGILTGWVPLPGPSVIASRKAPTDRFRETRTGQILIPMADGVFCRQVMFNNDTGLLSGDKRVRCEESMPENSKARMSRDLMSGLRGGFDKK
jgi:hypothetical protein